MRSIGIYSGTFDPIHEGHIAFAEAVLHDLKLDEIVFLPERQPRNKANVTELSVRAEQIQARIADNPLFTVGELPQDRFTIATTLPELARRYPDAKLTFLMGSDVAQHLASWPDIELLLDHHNIAIGLRKETRQSAVDETVKQLSNWLGVTITYTIHTTNFSHLSSSTLRPHLHDSPIACAESSHFHDSRRSNHM